MLFSYFKIFQNIKILKQYFKFFRQVKIKTALRIVQSGALIHAEAYIRREFRP